MPRIQNPFLKKTLAGLLAAGQLALLAPNVAFADATSDMLRRQSQYASVQQAAYQLVAEASDVDSDGTFETPAMKLGTGAGPSDGGVIPDASGAPKTDGFGAMLGYCAWDNGTSTSSTGRLAGGTAANKVSLAVVSYGLDNTFQTTCADLAAGTVKGDDYAFWMTSNQLSQGQSTSVSPYWGAPVANHAALLALDTSALHDGEVRLARDTNLIWRWTTGTSAWSQVGGGGAQNWADSGSDAYLNGKAAIGQTSLGAEQLTVNGGATAALGLKGTGATTGVSIYNTAGSAVNAFLGYDNTNSKLVLSAQTGSLSVQLGGTERLLVGADGSLALNGVAVFDASRNLTAGSGSFSGNVNTAGAYQVGGTTVIDTSRNLVNIAALTATGVANVGSLQIGGVTTIDASRNGSLASLTTTSGITAGGLITANGGVVATMLVAYGGGGVASNSAVGAQALYANTTGDSNTASGYRALYANTTGYNNTADGTQALTANTTGYNNTASGRQALYANTTGYSNTAIGVNALYANTTGYNNTVSGVQALMYNTTGTNNTASGVNALYANTTGYYNTATGMQALMYNTTGYYNTASGGWALMSNTTGINNTASGMQALYSNTTGNYNTASGVQALFFNTTGYYNTATGYRALYSNTTGDSNTAYGLSALSANTTGFSNTATGRDALLANTTGYRNTASGLGALYSNTTGSDNTASGAQTLYYNTTGYSNTASGSGALYSNTTGYGNTASGRQALYANTMGTYNTASGMQALYVNTMGGDNTASGAYALSANTTGSRNTATGKDALLANTTGANNTATGMQALMYNTTGNFNTASGLQALYSNTTGSNNTASGMYALFANTTGNYNTASGINALYSNTTGYYNTAIGPGAGYSITSGAYNTIIGGFSGNQGGLDIRTANNYIVLSDGAGNPRIVAAPTGNVVIGATADDGVNKLQVAGGISATTGTFSGALTAASFNGHATQAGAGVLLDATNQPYAYNLNQNLRTTDSPTFAGLTATTGNLSFTGSGQRITGDFSNATQTNRVLFQSSTVNGVTNVGAIPNGTGGWAGFTAFGAPDATNASAAQLAVDANTGIVTLAASRTGTGSFLPLSIQTSGAERMRVATSGNILIGTTTDDGVNKLQVNGGAAISGLLTANGGISSPTSQILGPAGSAALPSFAFAGSASSGLYAPAANTVALATAGTERLRVDSSGNVGIGTNAPLRRLTVSGGGFAFVDSGGASRSIHWGDTTDIHPVVISGNATAGNGYMSFSTAPYGTAAIERARITSAGNLLLNTTTDDGVNKLQVAGGISATTGAFSGTVTMAQNQRTYYAGNSTWGGQLYVGGDGINGIARTPTIASVATTNGNLHLDAGSDKALYLNYYSGTAGVQFGNGASSIVASISATGSFTGSSVVSVSGTEAQLQLSKTGSGANTSYLFNSATAAGFFDSTSGAQVWYKDRATGNLLLHGSGINSVTVSSAGLAVNGGFTSTGTIAATGAGAVSLVSTAAVTSGNACSVAGSLARDTNGDLNLCK